MPRPPTVLVPHKFHNAKHGKELIFLDNKFDFPVLAIAHRYRYRWQVGLFNGFAGLVYGIG